MPLTYYKITKLFWIGRHLPHIILFLGHGGGFVGYLLGDMQDNGLKRTDLANKLGVSPQYVSRLLSGTENLSFKSIANIENKLGIACMEIASM